MQQPEESTAEPEQPAATPPTINPAEWERFEGFRETFLLYFTRQDANAALRTTATLLYDLCLESGPFMPEQPEGSARAQVRAVVADLRFLQGFLDGLTEEAEGSSMEPYEEHLFRFAGKRSATLGQVADEIEAQLGAWRGETEV
ncbi:MAG TPA: hypothetical protein VEW48_14190 [Thermoanaerobaculia bacterium]|nr:hypothetical protein [Thermoanaerobaculia bacterium]